MGQPSFERKAKRKRQYPKCDDRSRQEHPKSSCQYRRSHLLHLNSTQRVGWNCGEDQLQYQQWGPFNKRGVHLDIGVHLWTTEGKEGIRVQRALAITRADWHPPRLERTIQTDHRDGAEGITRRPGLNPWHIEQPSISWLLNQPDRGYHRQVGIQELRSADIERVHPCLLPAFVALHDWFHHFAGADHQEHQGWGQLYPGDWILVVVIHWVQAQSRWKCTCEELYHGRDWRQGRQLAVGGLVCHWGW